MLKILTIVLVLSYGFGNLAKIIPSKYTIKLSLYNKVTENGRFSGTVTIEFENSGEKDIEEISLDADSHLLVSMVSVMDSSNNQMVYSFRKETFQQTNGTIVLKLAKSIPPKKSHKLSISYTGLLTKFWKGVYRSKYIDTEGLEKVVIAGSPGSKFAPLIFPCFNEPALKANYIINLFYDSPYKSWSNEPWVMHGSKNDVEKRVFALSTPLPTNLVAFAIADFPKCRSAFRFVRIQVCSRNEHYHLQIFAIKFAPEAVQIITDYTNMSLTEFDMYKIDIIAIPESYIDYTFDDINFGVGYFGLLIGPENMFLCDDKSSILALTNVFTNLAYQLASMWFGNGVTAKSRSYDFLNRGLAIYLQIHVLTQDRREIGFENYYVFQYIYPMLRREAGEARSMLQMSHETTSNLEDMMIYVKSGSIWRMISYAIGEENFRKGIISYLKTNKLKATTSRDLAASLSKYTNSVNMNNMIETWEENRGFPILIAKAKGKDVILQQNPVRFTNIVDCSWYIPITFTTSYEGNFTNTTPSYWFKPFNEHLRIPNVLHGKDDWIIFNNKLTSVYRVQYDLELWRRIFRVLMTDPTRIDPLMRAQLLEDGFCLTVTDKYSNAIYLEILQYLKKEYHYYPWKIAFKYFEASARLIYNEEIRRQFLAYSDKLSRHITERNVTNEAMMHTKFKQADILNWYCFLRKKQCLIFAKTNFHIMRKRFRIEPEIKYVVFCSVVRVGNNIEPKWNYLWKLYLNSTLEKQVILKALLCVRKQEIVERLFNYFFKTENMKTIMFFKIMVEFASDPLSQNFARSFIYENIDDLVEKCNKETYVNKCLKQIQFLLIKQFMKTDDHLRDLQELVGKKSIVKEKTASFLKSLEPQIPLAENYLKKHKEIEMEYSKFFSLNSNPKFKASICITVISFLIISNLDHYGY